MLTRYVLLDLECIPALDCDQWLSPFEADKRLTDPVKIAADVAHKRQAQLAAAALDADLNSIVAFGLWPHDAPHPIIRIITNHDEEALALETVWTYCNASTPMVGYGLMWFDLGVLMRRSQLLGVQVPSWVYRQGKYRHEQVIELADFLTLNGIIEVKKGRGLDYHCQRFGIHVDDVISGKDVPQAVADGRLEDVETHLRADLSRIQQLAQRLGVIPDNRTARIIPARETEAVF